MYSQLPAALLSSLEGVKGFDADSFAAVHAAGEQVTSIRLNPFKPVSMTGLGEMSRIPWSSEGYYLAQRPSFTFHPLFHAGAYYVQEASSMFLEQALKQGADLSRPLRVLDLCAAPGGKSTLVQSLLGPDSLLVSNEVIKTRVTVLRENVVKWGAANVVVTNNDPRDLGRLENFFDVIVVDAPCSGSGLFRREPEAMEQWSPENVELCHQRQQRILADIWPALRKDGLLVYSTCSYSQEEDEGILEWLLRDLDASGVRLNVDPAWNIIETEVGSGGIGYRFYPDRLKGEGFFLACVRKEGGGEFLYPRGKKAGVEKATKQEGEALGRWVAGTEALFFFHHDEYLHALPAALAEDLSYLQSSCYLKKAGVALGRLAAKEFIPEHEFALSTLHGAGIPSVELSNEEAIAYLRRDDLRLDTELRGWALVRHEGLALGWVKILPNRVNNYYPKDWRILKKFP